MKLTRICIAAAFALATTLSHAHGSADTPVAPANLTADSAVHRLTQLGYEEVRIVGQSEDSFDVELARGGQRYALAVSRKPTGPGTLMRVDVAEVVQRGLKPLNLQKIPVAPTAPTTSR
jgi:hypothetical protein